MTGTHVRVCGNQVGVQEVGVAIVGYARVSTREQATDAQEAELRAAGAQRVFVDHGVSSRPSRVGCMYGVPA